MSIIEKAAKRLAKGRRKGEARGPQPGVAGDTDANIAGGSPVVEDESNPFGGEYETRGGASRETATAEQADSIEKAGTASRPATAVDPASTAPPAFDAEPETISGQTGSSAEQVSPFQADSHPSGRERTEIKGSETVDAHASATGTTGTEAEVPSGSKSPFARTPGEPASAAPSREYRSSIAAAYSGGEGASPFGTEVSETGQSGEEPSFDASGESGWNSGDGNRGSDGSEPGDNGDIQITNLKPGLLLSPEGGRTRAAEEFRLIKRPLLVKAFDRRHEGHRHSNLIMVTSALQSEGKTFTSLNLAISITMEMDSTVLLVDADVAKPGLSKTLRISERSGLIEQLTDEDNDLANLLIRTDIPKLTVLPAGQRHKRSTELLASIKMRALMDEIASRYSDRIVLFDSPPLLESTEAFVLASQMGQVVLVVESESTSQMVVKEALSQFESLENVSLILNKCKANIFTNLLSGKYAGYGYGYGYGYGIEADTG